MNSQSWRRHCIDDLESTAYAHAHARAAFCPSRTCFEHLLNFPSTTMLSSLSFFRCLRCYKIKWKQSLSCRKKTFRFVQSYRSPPDQSPVKKNNKKLFFPQELNVFGDPISCNLLKLLTLVVQVKQSVCCVCVCLCLNNLPLRLKSVMWIFRGWFVLTLPKLNLKSKVVGQSSQSQEKCC